MAGRRDNPVIKVEDLVVRYGSQTVLEGVSFEVHKGEIFVILGGSGSGKTTLLRTLAGLVEPASGKIWVMGREFTTMSDDERNDIRRKIGMCFQGSALLNSISVAQNVALPLREHTRLEDSTMDIMVSIKLGLVGLAGSEHKLPAELSGGMRKRAGIARAMAMDPEIIFYDEPSAGLDPIVAAGLDALIRKMQNTFGLTSVVVTHEMESVRLIADRVCVLHGGKVAGIGPLADLECSDHPYIRQFMARQPDVEESGDTHYARQVAGLE